MSRYDDIIHLQRPISQRHSMSRSHRAKQFAPFAALKGFEESIRKKEKLYELFLEQSDERTKPPFNSAK